MVGRRGEDEFSEFRFGATGCDGSAQTAFRAGPIAHLDAVTKPGFQPIERDRVGRNDGWSKFTDSPAQSSATWRTPVYSARFRSS